MGKTLFDPDATERLTLRLNRLTPEHARRWGTMSVDEMICHVGDQLRVALGDVPSRPQGNLAWRTVIKWIVINVRMPMPKGAPTTSEMKTTRPVRFDADMRDFRELLSRFVSKNPSDRWGDHPKFGPLTGDEWGKLAFKHIDHHLRQFGE